MRTRFKIEHNEVTPVLRRLRRKLSPEGRRAFVLAWGRKVAVQAQRNARGKGGRSFWTEIARSINLRRTSYEEVEIYSDHVAAAQKQYGGPIEAPGKGPGSKGAKALTIPITPEAEGKTAAEFALSGRRLFAIGRELPEKGVLGYNDDNNEFVPLFALRRRTRTQRPDPFFPSPDEVILIGEQMAEKKLATF